MTAIVCVSIRQSFARMRGCVALSTSPLCPSSHPSISCQLSHWQRVLLKVCFLINHHFLLKFSLRRLHKHTHTHTVNHSLLTPWPEYNYSKLSDVLLLLLLCLAQIVPQTLKAPSLSIVRLKKKNNHKGAFNAVVYLWCTSFTVWISLQNLHRCTTSWSQRKWEEDSFGFFNYLLNNKCETR